MRPSLNAVILAAGQGTRMKLSTPKALAPLGGKCLIDYPLGALQGCDSDLDMAISVVVGHQKEELLTYLKKHYQDRVGSAWQKEQRGTADALLSFFQDHPQAYERDYTLVMTADSPLISSGHLDSLWSYVLAHQSRAAVATFHTPYPHGLGRIVRNAEGFSIVEEKEATQEQKTITEVNSGLYIFQTKLLQEHLSKITNKNKGQEFYLTDIFEGQKNCHPCLFEDGDAFMGVNDLSQLAQAETLLSWRLVQAHLQQGVRFLAPQTVVMESDVCLGPGAVIGPHCWLSGKTTVGAQSVVEAGCVLKNATVAQNVVLKAYSYLENARVEAGAQVGPFAHLREGSHIGANCRIGNFVETKKTTMAEGSKASHLTYIGDARIGKNTNIGCGFITCNFDGKDKHQTVIGEGCYIGSNSQTIPPVHIGDHCYVAAATTVNKDMPAGSFAISRPRQTTHEKMAKRFLKDKEK